MGKNKKKIIVVSAVVLLVIVIVAVFFTISSNKENADVKQNVEINLEAEPVIYYNFDNAGKMVLVDDNSTFSVDTVIIWSNSCTGKIKKDGKDFSKENNTKLLEHGKYEITVESPKKGSITKTINIDKIPPEFEIKEDPNGEVTITFKDVNDIETAILYKIDDETGKFTELLDLKKDGLKETFSVKEKGYYMVRCTDSVNNVNSKEFDIGTFEEEITNG